MAAKQIDIHQMIDLAIGCPEVGVVNYNVLHALLHLLATQLHIDDARIEFQGPNSHRTESLIPAISDKPLIEVTEYEINENNERTRKTDGKIREGKRILVVEQKYEGHGSGKKLKRPGIPQQPIKIISKEDLYHPTARTPSIHDAVANVLPQTIDLISQDTNPISEMVNMLNVTKRIDATEISVLKLAEIVNDLTKEYVKVTAIVQRATKGNDMFNLKDQMDELQKQVYDISQSYIFSSDSYSRSISGNSDDTGGIERDGHNRKHVHMRDREHGDNDNAKDIHKGSRGSDRQKGHGRDHSADVDKDGNNQRDAGGRKGSEGGERIMTPTKRRIVGEDSTCNVCHEIERIQNEIDYIKNALIKLAKNAGLHEVTKDIVNETKKSQKSRPSSAKNVQKEDCPEEKGTAFSEEEKRLLQILQRKVEKLERGGTTIDKRILQIESILSDLQNQLENVTENRGRSNEDEYGVAQLYNEVSKLTDETDRVKQRVKFLNVQITTQISRIEQFDEQIRNLEERKLDKDELDELLTDKADISMVQQKVSIEQFETSYRNASKGILEALKKIAALDEDLQGSLAELNTGLCNKVEMTVLNKLDSFVREKFNNLQERIKAMAALRHDPEAAGTRSKFLRNINCISCEADAIMNMREEGVVPKFDTMVPTKSIRPYLAFELDNLRQQMKDMPEGRNMIHFEEIMKDRQDAINIEKHSCARYCGGSHTAINAKDNFHRRNLPKSMCRPVPLDDSYVKGNDGVLYKGMMNNCCDCDMILKNENRNSFIPLKHAIAQESIQLDKLNGPSEQLPPPQAE